MRPEVACWRNAGRLGDLWWKGGEGEFAFRHGGRYPQYFWSQKCVFDSIILFRNHEEKYSRGRMGRNLAAHQDEPRHECQAGPWLIPLQRQKRVRGDVVRVKGFISEF